MKVEKVLEKYNIVSYAVKTKAVQGIFVAAVPKDNKGLAGAIHVTEVKTKVETAVKSVASKLK